MSAQTLNLVAAADTESGADGDLRQLPNTLEVTDYFVGNNDVLASGARHGHRVHEALADLAQLFEALRLCHRGDHLNHGDSLCIQRPTQIAALVVRQVRHDES